MKSTAKKNTDHRGIVLTDRNMNWGPRPFRVFNIWLKEEILLKLIQDMTKEINSKRNVQITLKKIKGLIKEWNLGSNGNVNLRIEKMEVELAELEDRVGQGQEIDILKMELDELHLVRDSMLRQQARISWLKDGDRNTKIFHHSIQRRRSKNNIRKIMLQGESIVDPVKIKLAFLEHYKAQFSKRKIAKMFSVRNLMVPLVSQEDNEFLTREVTDQ